MNLIQNFIIMIGLLVRTSFVLLMQGIFLLYVIFQNFMQASRRQQLQVTLVVISLLILYKNAPDAYDLIELQQASTIDHRYRLAIDKSDLNHGSGLPQTFFDWETHTVRTGESTSVLFKRIGLSAGLLQSMLIDEESKKQLSNLRPGMELRFGFDDQHELIQLIRPIGRFDSFVITRTEDGFKSRYDRKVVHTRYNYASAVIKSSFWNAGKASGLSPNQIMEVAGMFAWDIDFALDIRKGDTFRVLYEEKIVEGNVVAHGKIVAAIFNNQGDTFKSIRDGNSGNYYDEKGSAMKKAFLRAPIDFRRVSSNFDPKRLHPVTGLVRPHRGTDYVAPVGTAIWAAGDGVVLKSSYNRFNGNYVFIRHTQKYTTKYLHMKKRLVKTGQRVKQGQSIGHLGGTGRVTGPHLHYEFLVHGVHKNPRTVKLPKASSLHGTKRSNFVKMAKKRLAQLERFSLLMQAK